MNLLAASERGIVLKNGYFIRPKGRGIKPKRKLKMDISLELIDLSEKIEGEIKTDNLHKIIYSTDASAYKEKPEAVIYPKNKADIKEIILFANKFKVPLIPRTAGTSLAGQVVGKGIIVDVSKYMTQIIDIDEKYRTVTVQPGVIRDELNRV